MEEGSSNWKSLFRLSTNSIKLDRKRYSFRSRGFQNDAMSQFRNNQHRYCGSQIPGFFYRTFQNQTEKRHMPTLVARSCINREKSKLMRLPEIKSPTNFTRVTFRQVLENNTFYVRIGKNRNILRWKSISAPSLASASLLFYITISYRL